MQRKICSAVSAFTAITMVSGLLSLSGERSVQADEPKDKDKQIKELETEKAKLKVRLTEVEAQLEKLRGRSDASKDLEKAARELNFYGTALHLIPSKGVRAEWSSTPRIDRELIKADADCLKKLRAQRYPSKDLITLLKHNNPRVRTLSAYLLATRGDAKARPLLAALQNDKAPTFPKHRMVAYDCGAAGVWYPTQRFARMQERLKPVFLGSQTQTVGEVIKKLLASMPVPK